MDTDALSLNIIQIMIEQVPTPEEQQAVSKHIEECSGDFSKIDKAEKYIYEMSKVMNCWTFEAMDCNQTLCF